MRNVEKHNFAYNGCEIKFYERPFDYDVDVIISKGNLKRHYQLTDLIHTIEYRTIEGTWVLHTEEKTEERIKQFKELVMKGGLELL